MPQITSKNKVKKGQKYSLTWKKAPKAKEYRVSVFEMDGKGNETKFHQKTTSGTMYRFQPAKKTESMHIIMHALNGYLESCEKEFFVTVKK